MYKEMPEAFYRSSGDRDADGLYGGNCHLLALMLYHIIA